MLKWANMKSLLQGDTFYTKIEKCDLEIGRKGLTNEQKLVNIQSLVPPEFNEEKAKEIDPAFEVLWTFLTTALDYRTTNLKQAQADYDAKKKAAEEADPPEPFEEPDPQTID